MKVPSAKSWPLTKLYVVATWHESELPSGETKPPLARRNLNLVFAEVIWRTNGGTAVPVGGMVVVVSAVVVSVMVMTVVDVAVVLKFSDVGALLMFSVTPPLILMIVLCSM